jgi:Cytochrome b5-like Heme/Steroid binding domain
MCTHVGTKGRNLGISQMGVFYSLFAIVELAFQIYRRKKFNLKNPTYTMTREEFRKNCEEGQELVILDDLVLNVGNFSRYHPGGYFAIHQNRSRDVSKFFYGGYQMNGSSLAATRPYTHSNYSILTANKMVVARYENRAPEVVCLVKDRY